MIENGKSLNITHIRHLTTHFCRNKILNPKFMTTLIKKN